MATKLSYTFGDLVGKVATVEVDCAKCSRRGRYRLDKLIERYGAGHAMTEWRDEITADCPLRHEITQSNYCQGGRFQQLSELFPAEAYRPRR